MGEVNSGGVGKETTSDIMKLLLGELIRAEARTEFLIHFENIGRSIRSYLSIRAD
jgi:hypothetical protein